MTAWILARLRQGAAAVVAAVLVGCAGIGAEPRTDARPAEPPAAWTASPAVLPGEPGGWLADFDSPALTALVDEAIAANYDLAAAAARVDAAAARARIAGADRLPQLDLELTGQRSQSLFQGVATSTSITRNRFALDLGVSWEADVWGRLGNAARAALAEARASEADLRAARLSLAAQVARAWFTAVEAGQQLALSQVVVDYFRQSLGVTEDRYRLGIGTALDLRLARENVASAEATRAQRQRERDAALRSLETLLGRYPDGDQALPDELPDLRAEVPAGLPSGLLERRPDLIAARERLLASSERVREANKNLLPRLRLTASGGTASDELEDVVDFDRLVWSLFASLLQPLYQGGRLQAQRVLALADNTEAWAGYAQAVLDAFREVETALAAEAYWTEQEAALRRAAEEAREAAFLALDRYRQGLTDIVTLLESQRRAVNAQSSRLLVSRLRLENRVNLYLALGGPFEGPAPAAAALEAR